MSHFRLKPEVVVKMRGPLIQIGNLRFTAENEVIFVAWGQLPVYRQKKRKLIVFGL